MSTFAQRMEDYQDWLAERKYNQSPEDYDEWLREQVLIQFAEAVLDAHANLWSQGEDFYYTVKTLMEERSLG